MGTGAKAAGA